MPKERTAYRSTYGVHCYAASAFFLVAALSWGQGVPAPLENPQPGAVPLPTPQADAPLLTPQQLDDLVAPIALYPDPLLGQVLAASTYPLEIVDAEQWLQQNRNTPPAQRVEAAKQQQWDPSVQAMVAFPDVLDILGHDIRWTTDLGNAFLAQQSDLMAAVQRMRVRAQQTGQLRSTPQQAVTTQYEDGQSAVQIQPADPQVIYVPMYQPAAIWGPPVYGAYPSLWYPPAWGGYGGYGGYDEGIGFSPGTFLGSLFSGLLNYGPWGWGVNWASRALFLIPQFFEHFFGDWWGGHGYGIYGGGFYHGGFIAGRPLWIHEGFHRMGVPYANHAVAARFGGRVGGPTFSNRGFASNGGIRSEGIRGGETRAAAPRGQVGGAWNGVGSNAGRAASPGFGGNSFAGGRSAPQTGRAPENTARSFAPSRGYAPNSSTQRSFSQPSRSFSEPARSFSQPSRSYTQPSRSLTQPAQSFARPSQNFSRPSENSSRPQQNFSARNFSAPRSSANQPAQHFSAPRSSGGGGGHVSAPRASGGSHGGGGGHSSGGSSHGGGGHSSGGHHK